MHNPIKEQELRNDLVKAEQTERTLEAKQAELVPRTQSPKAKARSKKSIESSVF